ncbi:MAG: hypothetical protein ACE5FI_19335 [Anaerolineales bacterium]
MSFDDIKWLAESKRIQCAIDVGTTQAPRAGREHYLGMSGLGGCAAEQWHNYHIADAHGVGIDPPLQRIFDLGNTLEDVVIGYLNAGGVTPVSVQAEYTDFDGRLRGHSDFVYDTPDGHRIVMDVKSMNDRNYQWLAKTGVKNAQWKYYCQLMMYARYEQADAVQLIAYNKNDSRMLVQTMGYDETTADMLRARAQMILDAPSKPPCEKGNGRVKWCNCKQTTKP